MISPRFGGAYLLAESRYLLIGKICCERWVIWVLFTGDCRRVVCDGQSTDYECGGFIRHCFVLSGTLTLRKPSPALAIDVILIAALTLLATTSCFRRCDGGRYWLVKMAGGSEIKMLVLLMITVSRT